MTMTEQPARAAFAIDACAIVTGGSRGIGRAAAEDLARHGVHVVLTYSGSEAAAKEVVRTIEAEGGSAVAEHVDVRDEVAVRSLFRTVREERGHVDAVVNAAGITRDGFVAGMSRAKFSDVMDVNVLGTFFSMRESVKIMADQRSGSIVNVTSVSFAHGVPGQVNYCASKGAIASMTRAASAESAPWGVRVNAVAPGFIETDMTRKLRGKTPRPIPMGRFGRPEEVASVITFLASQQASYVTGSIVVVDGGLG